MKALHKWVLLFGIKAGIIYAALALLYHTILFFNGFYWLQLLEARLVFSFLQTLCPEISLNGIILGNLAVAGNYSSFAISIEPICIGWFPITAFASMVLALPIERKKIWKCLAIGIPTLFAANLARIVLVAWVAAAYGLEAFNLFHLGVVKFDLMVLVLLLFLLCVQFVVGKKALLSRLSQEKE